MARKTKSEQQPNVELVNSIKIPIELVDNNVGQIPDVRENPREMTEMEFKKLKKSLKRDAAYTAYSELKLYPLKGRWVTIGGNMRLQAMKELGWTEVIGKAIPEGTPAEVLNRWILLDNANFGKWDFDKLANEWEEQTFLDMNIDIPVQPNAEAEETATDDNCDPDALKPKQPRSRLGDIYVLGHHRLICGDSTKSIFLEALMGNDRADMIVTDPPYNVNYRGGTADKLTIANDNMESSQFQDFLADAFAVADKHLKPGGAFYIWHASWGVSDLNAAVRRTGWDIKQTIIWNKNALVLGRQDYQWKHEPCLYGWKDGASHYFAPRRDLVTMLENKPDIEALTKDELKAIVDKIYNGDIPTTVIDEAKPLRNAEHPTMKPVPLIGRLIKNSSRPGEIVLDMFGGSGTTLIAAEQLGRKCRMVELDPIYADVIIKRWEEFTGEKAQYVGNCLENSTESNS